MTLTTLHSNFRPEVDAVSGTNFRGWGVVAVLHILARMQPPAKGHHNYISLIQRILICMRKAALSIATGGEKGPRAILLFGGQR